MFIYVLLRLVYLICIAPFLSSRRFLQSCQTARSGCPRCIVIYTTPCSTYRILECSIGLYTKHTPPTEALYVHFNFQTFNVVDFNVVDHLCSSSIILDFSCTGVDTALGYNFPGVFCNALSLHCLWLKWPCNALSGWAGLTDWDFCSRDESFWHCLGPPPFSLPFSPPHSCTHLMPCYWRVKCFNSRIYTLETTLEATLDLLLGPKCISSSTEWQEMAAVDLFAYRTRVCMSALAVRILL